MEVKMNKEVTEYRENVFMGLSVRKVVWLVLAGIVAICVYFWAKPRFGENVTSILCMISAVPCILMGFFKRNGLYFDRYILTVFRFYFVVPRFLYFKSENPLYEKYQRSESVVKNEEKKEKECKNKPEKKPGHSKKKNKGILVHGELNPESEEKDNAEGQESHKTGYREVQDSTQPAAADTGQKDI